MKLQALAPAKVNLSLFLGGTREDGRHRLVTVFESLSLADTLELEVIEGAWDEVVCPGVEGENLAARALARLRAHGWDGPPGRVTIEKRIPVAAGMARGSADRRSCVAIGDGGRARTRRGGRADRGRARCRRAGPVDAQGSLSEPAPGRSSSTSGRWPSTRSWWCRRRTSRCRRPTCSGEADRLGLQRPDAELDALYEEAGGAPWGPIRSCSLSSSWINDLEAVAAVSLCPWCGSALEAMRAAGAEHAMVSGSGPTVVGIWWDLGAVGRAFAAAQRLRADYPLAVGAEPVTAEYAAPSLT